MTEEKVIREIVTESVKDPRLVDSWRILFDNNNDMIMDFGKQVEGEEGIEVVSRNLIPKDGLNNFLEYFIGMLWGYNQERDLQLEMFKHVELKVEDSVEEE